MFFLWLFTLTYQEFSGTLGTIEITLFFHFYQCFYPLIFLIE